MKRTRDWRRAQRDRSIARAKRHMRSNGWFTSPYTRWSDEDARAAIRQNAITPHPCSQVCCGNPRHWYTGDAALTMQERRFAAGLAEF